MNKVKFGVCSCIIYVLIALLCVSWLGSGEVQLIERGLWLLLITITVLTFGAAFLRDKNRSEIKNRLKVNMRYRSLNIVFSILCVFVLFQVASYEFSEAGKKEREDLSILYNESVSALQDKELLPENLLELSKYFPNCFKGNMLVAIDFINMSESVATSLGEVAAGTETEPRLLLTELPDVESKASLFIYPLYMIRDSIVDGWDNLDLSKSNNLMKWYMTTSSIITVVFSVLYSMAFRGYVVLIELLGSVISYIIKRDKAE